MKVKANVKVGEGLGHIDEPLGYAEVSLAGPPQWAKREPCGGSCAAAKWNSLMKAIWHTDQHQSSKRSYGTLHRLDNR